MHVPEEVTLTVSVSKKFVYRQRCRRGRTLSTDMFRHGVDEGSHGAKARKMSVIHLDNGGGGDVERWWCDSLHVYRIENSLQGPYHFAVVLRHDHSSSRCSCERLVRVSSRAAVR